MIGVAILFSLICVVAFVAVWKLENCYHSIVFTPFLIFCTHEMINVLPGFIYAISIGLSKDLYALLMFCSGFISFLLGFIVSLRNVRHSASSISEYRDREVDYGSVMRLRSCIIFFAPMLILIGLYSYKGLPPVTTALAGLLMGGRGDSLILGIGESREFITKSHYFGGEYRGQGVFRVLMQTAWPIVVLMAYLSYRKMRDRSSLIALILVAFAAVVFISGDGTRSHVVSMLTMFFVLYSLVERVRLRTIGFAFIGIVIVGIAVSLYSPKMYFLLNDESFLSKSVGGIIHRILILNALDSVYAIEYARDGALDYPFANLHVRDFLNAIPGVHIGPPFENELNAFIEPYRASTTYATTTYIGIVYVDFSGFGVVVVYFLVGLMLGNLQKTLL